MNFSINSSKRQLFWYIETKGSKRYVAVGLALRDEARADYSKLKAHREEIAQELGYSVTPDEPLGDRQSYFSMVNDSLDPLARDQWNEAAKWICERLERAIPVFRKWIRQVQ